MTTLAPGAVIGIIGGGQLGRMLSMAAAQLGYRCFIYAPEKTGPAADVCAKWVQGDYGDAAALATFAKSVDVVNMNFVAFSHYLGDMHGQVFVFFISTVAAAESAIGLAILVLLFRNLNSIDVDKLDSLKG